MKKKKNKEEKIPKERKKYTKKGKKCFQRPYFTLIYYSHTRVRIEVCFEYSNK